MEEVVVEIMKANKAIDLFQTMANLNLNMGNLTLELHTLKNKLAIGEKEKAVLHEELDRKKNSKRGINIMWKFGGRIG